MQEAIESKATATIAAASPPAPDPGQQFAFITPRQEWHGFTAILDRWIASPQFNHTHYLANGDYSQAFDHIFLMLGRLRKRMIAVRISDTGGGDTKDEIRLIHNNKKFRIRPI